MAWLDLQPPAVKSIPFSSVHGLPPGAAGTAGMDPCLPLGEPHCVRFHAAASGRKAVTSSAAAALAAADARSSERIRPIGTYDTAGSARGLTVSAAAVRWLKGFSAD